MKSLFKYIPLVLLLLCSSAKLLAQSDDVCNHEIKGQILDEHTKEPLPFVQVQIKDTEVFTYTDSIGFFHLEELCEPENILVVSCLGYCDHSCHKDCHADETHFIFLKQDIKQIETLTVSASRTKSDGTLSIAQESIDIDKLLSPNAQSLATVLAEIEGLSFSSSGNNVQLPVIHGLNGNRILVMNNGLKHGFQNWGEGHAPEIDISSASNITVIKGAAGVRFGPEALGGAILINANPLHIQEPLNFNVGTGYQSNGRGYHLNAALSQGLEQWSYHLGASYNRVGDRHAPDYVLTNSGKEEKAINAGLRYVHKDLNITSYYSYLGQNLGILRSSIASSANAITNAINAEQPLIIKDFSYEINEPNQLVNHHLAKIEAKWRYRPDATFSLRIGSQLNQREEFDVRRNADSPIIDLDLITNDIQLEWNHPVWKGIEGIIGIQGFSQNNDNNPGTQTTPLIPNYNSYRFSAFAVESFKRNRSTFELGLRLDHEYNNVRGREPNQDIFRDEYSFTNLTASLGYIRYISDETTFRTNFATAWRGPNVAELFSFGQRGFRSSFGLLRYYADPNDGGSLKTDQVIPFSNSNIATENGYKWISEWQTEKGSNSLNVTGYTHYIQSYIFERPLAIISTIRGPMPVFIYDQEDALFIGTDFTWKKNWNSNLEGTFGFSYLWSLALEDNEALINQPPLALNYKLDWKLPNVSKTISSALSIQPSYTFRQYQAPITITPEELINGSVLITPESEIFDLADAPDGYFLLDATYQIKSDRFRAGLTVQNILNSSYRDYLNELRYFADEPGINFILNINYYFNTKSY